MPEPNSDLQSKIARAVKALLLAEGAGSTIDTIAAPSDAERSLPNTTISAGDGDEFAGPGNYKFPVWLELCDAAVTQADEPNDQATRVSANERFTRIWNALNRSDDGHTLQYTANRLTTLGRALAVDETSGADPLAAQRAIDNADMADFTVLWWEASPAGAANKITGKESSYWSRDLQFACVACNSTLT